MSKVPEVELDLYNMKTNKLNIPNFKSISQTCQKTAEKTPENYSCKSRSSVTKLELDLYYVIHDKFIYQISSQYLKRLQRKVWKTEVRRTDGQTARKLFFNNKSVSGKPIWD